MALQVNLLKKSRALSERQYQLERKVLLGAIISFVVVVCVMMGVFAWQWVVTSQLAQVNTTIANATAQLANVQTSNVQQLYMKSRLKLVTKIFGSRVITREALQRILAISLPGVKIGTIAFESTDKVKVAVTADSVKSFDAVYQFFEGTKDFFKSVVNEGMNRSQDGSYVMTLVLQTSRE